MNVQKLTQLFGWVFIAIGILGFIPGITSENAEGHRMLLGLFEVDGTHNLIHLLSGAAALIAAKSAAYARTYLRVFGVVYGLVFLLGLMQDEVLGLFPVNTADNLLHLVLAAAALYGGFMLKDSADSTATTDKAAV